MRMAALPSQLLCELVQLLGHRPDLLNEAGDFIR